MTLNRPQWQIERDERMQAEWNVKKEALRDRLNDIICWFEIENKCVVSLFERIGRRDNTTEPIYSVRIYTPDEDSHW